MSESEYTSQKSYASNVRMSLFGLINFQVDVVPIQKSAASSDTGFKMVAATETGLQGVRQRYIDDNDNMWELHELKRARNVDGTWVEVSKEEQIAAKTGGLLQNVVNLKVHDARLLADSTYPGVKGYRLRPGRVRKKVLPDDEQLYCTLREFVKQTRDQYAFVGSLRVRDNRQVYRLDTWRDQMILAELSLGDDLYEPDHIVADIDGELLSTLGEFSKLKVEPWVPSEHRWDAAEAIRELVARKASGDVEDVAPAVESKAQTSDLAALLKARMLEEKELVEA